MDFLKSYLLRVRTSTPLLNLRTATPTGLVNLDRGGHKVPHANQINGQRRRNGPKQPFAIHDDGEHPENMTTLKLNLLRHHAPRTRMHACQVQRQLVSRRLPRRGSTTPPQVKCAQFWTTCPYCSVPQSTQKLLRLSHRHHRRHQNILSLL